MKFRRLYIKATDIVKRWRNQFTRVTFLEGSNGDGEIVTLVHEGWDRKLMLYWAGRIFETGPKRIRTNYMAAGHFEKRLADEQIAPDVAILESHPRMIPRERRSQLLLPRWMELTIDVDISLQKHYTKEILRRIRKHGIVHEFSDTREDLDEFYYRMYKPLMMLRHRETAELAPYDYFYRKFQDKQLELMFLTRDGKRVAGLVVDHRDGLKRILAFGVLEGKDEILKWGVHAAAYYYTLLRCREQGHSQILCGSSMPVVFDGVTQFKLRLGAKPYLEDLPTRKKYSLVLFDESPRVLERFTSSPLYYLRNDALRVRVFINAALFNHPNEFYRHLKLIRSQNVEKVECHVFNDPEMNITNWVKEGKIEPVELILT